MKVPIYLSGVSLIGLALCLAACGGHDVPRTQHVAPNVYALNLYAVDMDYDTATQQVYAIASGTDPEYPQKVVQIDPNLIKVTNVAGPATVIPPTWTTPAVFLTPTHIAASKDGKLLFVGGYAGGQGYVFPLSASTLSYPGSSLALPAGYIPSDLVGDPGASETYAVASVDDLTPMLTEPVALVDGVVMRPNAANLGGTVAFSNTGAAIYGLQEFVDTPLVYTQATVKAFGIAGATMLQSTEQGPVNAIHWANGLIVTDSGDVLEPTSGTIVTHLNLPAGSSNVAAPIPGTNQVYFVSWNGSSSITVFTYDITTYNLVGSAVPCPQLGPVTKAVWAGTGTVVFATQTSKVVIVTGLPS